MFHAGINLTESRSDVDDNTDEDVVPGDDLFPAGKGMPLKPAQALPNTQT